MPERSQRAARAAEPVEQKRGRGGKRKDANGKQHTVMLEKETHLTALDLLHRHDEGWDLSD